MDLDDLRKKRMGLKQKTDDIFDNMDIIIQESNRVADVAKNADVIFDELDKEFEKQTGLDKRDVKFLFFATALQIGRWIVINKVNQWATEKINNSRLKHDDKSIKKMEKDARDKFKSKHEGKWPHNKSDKYPTWLEIVYSGVPYDVTAGSPKFGVNMEGGNHRVHTLGHDPILGWIFGTMNILSSTITIEDFRTYKVSRKPKYWESETNVFEGFRMAIESIKEDEKRLLAAIFTQALHLKSDAFTKNGLPVPILEAFSSELAGKLYKENYDSLILMKDIAVVGVQAVGAILINMVISLIHGLYYNPEIYSSREIYEVKTRKILMYSNLISSTSNLIWVGGNAALGNEAALKDLDIGGIMVTMYRLVSDTNFIRAVKEEFILGGFKDMIQGDKLDLKEV